MSPCAQYFPPGGKSNAAIGFLHVHSPGNHRASSNIRLSSYACSKSLVATAVPPHSKEHAAIGVLHMHSGQESTEPPQTSGCPAMPAARAWWPQQSPHTAKSMLQSESCMFTVARKAQSLLKHQAVQLCLQQELGGHSSSPTQQRACCNRSPAYAQWPGKHRASSNMWLSSRPYSNSSVAKQAHSLTEEDNASILRLGLLLHSAQHLQAHV